MEADLFSSLWQLLEIVHRAIKPAGRPTTIDLKHELIQNWDQLQDGGWKGGVQVYP